MNPLRVCLVIPAHNEEAVLGQNMKHLHEACLDQLSSFDWHIVVAVNGSADRTLEIARAIAVNNERLSVLELQEAGKGLAIRWAWEKALDKADIFVFMDADLSASLEHLQQLVEATLEADIVIGSRRLPGSRVTRSLSRSLMSWIYTAAARVLLQLPYSDIQCGFKAVSKRVVAEDLSSLTENGFFFDTELLWYAHQKKRVVCEIPVTWTDAADRQRKSRVHILSTSLRMLLGLLRLKKRQIPV